FEPGADGLDQIRTKIAARQSARHHLGWWIASLPREVRVWWHGLLPPRDWIPVAVAAVVERFRPDPNRSGWFGWLRPAAAAVTGLFVVSAASWALAIALPAALHSAPQTSTTSSSAASPTKHHKTSATRTQPSYTGTNSGGGTTQGGQRGGVGGGPGGSSNPSC